MDVNTTNELVWGWNYESLRRILELASFLGTAVVGGFAFFVFQQLRMAKKSLETAQEALTAAKDDMQIRIQRESVILAADQTEKFRTVILQDSANWEDEMIKKGLGLKEWVLENSRFDETSIKDVDGLNTFIRDTDDLHPAMTDILNEMETFALYFVEGAADETIAFPSTSTVFCYTVRLLAPFLIALRKNNVDRVSGPYQNLITLYEKWSSRMKKDDLDSQARQLMEQSSQIHITDVPVLGRNRN